MVQCGEHVAGGQGASCADSSTAGTHSPLVQVSTSPPMDTSYRGSTHAFGNTEEHLRRANIGVKAQEGDQRWDNAKGTGKVRAHKGLYHDAIHVKRNEFWLAIAEIFGGLNKVARRLFKLYKERARHGVDRTQYVASDSGASHFGAHWSQLLSAAIVIGDARRSLRAVDMKRRACAAAAAARPRPQTAGRAATREGGLERKAGGEREATSTEREEESK